MKNTPKKILMGINKVSDSILTTNLFRMSEQDIKEVIETTELLLDAAKTALHVKQGLLSHITKEGGDSNG